MSIRTVNPFDSNHVVDAVQRKKEKSDTSYGVCMETKVNKI